MTIRCVVLPRGINLGGHNRVPMAELRPKLAEAGYADPATILQSGNIIVTAELASEPTADLPDDAASVRNPPNAPRRPFAKSLALFVRRVTTVGEMQGRSTIAYLIEAGRLERVAVEGRQQAGAWVLGQAERRLGAAITVLEIDDIAGAFSLAYDAYRLEAESLLLRQCLRPMSGEGSHIAVEDAVSSQFADSIPQFAKPTFERFRRNRHAARYYDADTPPLTGEDARWAISLAEAALEGSRRVGEEDALEPFSPDRDRSEPEAG